MIFIAAGKFTMGAADPKNDPLEDGIAILDRGDELAIERPAHAASLDSYCIDRTEVTTSAYAACVAKQRCTVPVRPESSKACNWGVPGRENHPINCINWVEARDYCVWRGARLPTEKQWEYAARGADKRWYPWGNVGQQGKNYYCEGETTCVPGTFPKSQSPFGVEDMIGNVAEWTVNTICQYPKDDCANPADDRVYRGIGFDRYGIRDRVTTRWHAPSTFASDQLGVRCVAPPKK